MGRCSAERHICTRRGNSPSSRSPADVRTLPEYGKVESVFLYTFPNTWANQGRAFSAASVRPLLAQLVFNASSLRMEVFILQNHLPRRTMGASTESRITTDRWSVKAAVTVSTPIFLSLISFFVYTRSILCAPIGD